MLLFCEFLVQVHYKYCLVWSVHLQKGIVEMEKVQERTSRGQESLPCVKQLHFGLFGSLEKSLTFKGLRPESAWALKVFTGVSEDDRVFTPHHPSHLSPIIWK